MNSVKRTLNKGRVYGDFVLFLLSRNVINVLLCELQENRFFVLQLHPCWSILTVRAGTMRPSTENRGKNWGRPLPSNGSQWAR